MATQGATTSFNFDIIAFVHLKLIMVSNDLSYTAFKIETCSRKKVISNR